MKNTKIIDFITHFSNFGTEVIDCFTKGNCYWFARILQERFSGTIMYNPVDGHFATEIDGDLYDITGRIDKVSGPWEIFDLFHMDNLQFLRIFRQCVRFEE